MRDTIMPNAPTQDPAPEPAPPKLRETAPLYEPGHSPWRTPPASPGARAARRTAIADRTVWLVATGTFAVLTIAAILWLLLAAPALR